MAAGLLYLTLSGDHKGVAANIDDGSGLWLLLLVCAGAFFCEYVDSALGMGYGTTLTPALLLLGFQTSQIVPAVLVSEFLSGILAGVLHHSVGNVTFRKGSRDTLVLAVLALCSLVGTCAAVAVSVTLPAKVLQLWIGVLVAAMGVIVLWSPRFASVFSWPRTVGLGLVAAFNKGLSGGGYGPLVTSGQILSGVDPKRSVGITSMAEGLVCLAGAVLYVCVREGAIYWPLAVPLTVGALLSVPLATWTVKTLPPVDMRRSVGFATLFLGLLTLIKLFQ
ncbi:MAG: sulfite exporter TauE/SafE family protein [Armatimonadetes bacterium]|nr:sulfite exporter TauE/SafE family protein [Armatimonadota bacterium]